MINAYDIVTARIMLYCLHKIDGFSYAQISKCMGYSDGVCHKFISGASGSVLLLKCVRDFVARRGSERTKLVAARLQNYHKLFGSILFTSVREAEFLRVVGLISQDVACDSYGDMQQKHAKSSAISRDRTHHAVNDAATI